MVFLEWSIASLRGWRKTGAGGGEEAGGKHEGESYKQRCDSKYSAHVLFLLPTVFFII